MSMHLLRIPKNSGVSFEIGDDVSIAVANTKNGVCLMMDGSAESIRRENRLKPKKWPIPIIAAGPVKPIKPKLRSKPKKRH